MKHPQYDYMTVEFVEINTPDFKWANGKESEISDSCRVNIVHETSSELTKWGEAGWDITAMTQYISGSFVVTTNLLRRSFALRGFDGSK